MVMIMNYPTRKHPRLKQYDYTQNGAYHITICTKKRETILSSIVDQMIRSLKIMVRKQSGISPFQTSFHEHVIRGYQDYCETWEYIQNNPFK